MPRFSNTCICDYSADLLIKSTWKLTKCGLKKRGKLNTMSKIRLLVLKVDQF